MDKNKFKVNTLYQMCEDIALVADSKENMNKMLLSQTIGLNLRKFKVRIKKTMTFVVGNIKL